MNEYKATREGTRTIVLRKNESKLGEVRYHKWSVGKADITLQAGATYMVRPKGFWQTTTEVMQDERVLADYKMTWRKGTELNTYFDTITDTFHFRYRGFWKGRYELQDANGEPVLVVTSSFRWKGFRTEFQLEPSVAFDRHAHKELLMLITLCCLTQQQRTQAAAAAS